jgi:hypothetical protein
VPGGVMPGEQPWSLIAVRTGQSPRFFTRANGSPINADHPV